MTPRSRDHVHRLVRSMTRAEKRYFKLHTGRHLNAGHSNMQLLFDAIASMEEYDEAALLARFSREAFIKRFAVTKRRLYETILKSLDAFHAEASLDVRLHRLLHQVEVLHRKALYEDAYKMLQSLRRLARQHDRQAVLAAALQWERRLLECGNYASASTAALDRLNEESRDLRSEQAELDTLWDLKSRVLMGIYRRGSARDAGDQQELDKLMDHPLLDEGAALHSARARFLHHHVRSAACHATGDMAGCHHHLSANRALLLEQQERFMDEPNLVLGVLSNLVHVSLRLGRFEEAHAHLQEYRTMPVLWNMPESEDLDLKLFSTSVSLELAMHGRMGSFDKALELVSTVERGLERFGPLLGPVRKAGFYYQLAYVHFGAGHMAPALRWVQRLLNDVRIDDSAEIVSFGRMLNLLLLWETDKHDLLPYALRNMERFLRSHGRTYRFEELFLDLIRGAMRCGGRDFPPHLLEEFLAATEPLGDDPAHQVVLDHFDYLSWARSRVDGRPFPELVRERAMQLVNDR